MNLMHALIFAQIEWPLKSWTEVEGKSAGQQFGLSVSYLGKKNDSTLVGVGDRYGTIYVYQMKSPADTIPKFTLRGSNCVLGDFNGDGIPDVATGGNPARIYLGRSPGVFDTIPFFMGSQEANGYEFGYRIAAGDVNGDGCDDLLVSDPGYPNGNFAGRVYLFLGAAKMDTVPYAIFNGDSIGYSLGERIALGDLNNDGFADVIAMGFNSNDPFAIHKYCYIKIFLGGNSVDTIPSKYFKGTFALGDIACFDANGDGKKDLLWSNADTVSLASVVYVHVGKPSIDSIPNFILKDPGVDGLDVIANAGDMNGDGYNDILVGSPGANQGLGMVLVYSGGPKMDANYDAAAGLSVVSYFGWSVVSVGDINGDGFADIAVGAPNFKWNEARGKWFILLGDSHIPVAAVRKARDTAPTVFELFQNYPNPFNPTTTITFSLSKSSYTTLKLYDLLGREIITLIAEDLGAGTYSKVWHADAYSSGVYFCTLRSGGFVESKKILLHK